MICSKYPAENEYPSEIVEYSQILLDKFKLVQIWHRYLKICEFYSKSFLLRSQVDDIRIKHKLTIILELHSFPFLSDLVENIQNSSINKNQLDIMCVYTSHDNKLHDFMCSDISFESWEFKKNEELHLNLYCSKVT